MIIPKEFAYRDGSFACSRYFPLDSNAASITQVNIDEQQSPGDVMPRTYDICVVLEIWFIEVESFGRDSCDTVSLK